MGLRINIDKLIEYTPFIALAVGVAAISAVQIFFNV